MRTILLPVLFLSLVFLAPSSADESAARANFVTVKKDVQKQGMKLKNIPKIAAVQQPKPAANGSELTEEEREQLRNIVEKQKETAAPVAAAEPPSKSTREKIAATLRLKAPRAPALFPQAPPGAPQDPNRVIIRIPQPPRTPRVPRIKPPSNPNDQD